MTSHQGRVLIIAGSDSGGGAGIQADIKTVTMLGGYAATAVTAVTVQNTLGVQAIHAVPPAVVAAQIRAVLEDLGADAIKIGMLGDAATVAAVADALSAADETPLVLDPVMAAKGGEPLLADDAVDAIKSLLLPHATIVTPNAPEAARLTGAPATTALELEAAGQALIDAGAGAAMMKGGHVAGDEVVDLLVSPDGVKPLSNPRIPTEHTHGTGCTLASAIAAGLALGQSLHDAVVRAHAYVYVAIAKAPGFGQGRGPLNHAWPIQTPEP